MPTWTQDLRRHIHLHAVMACGVRGKDEDGCHRWHTPTRKPGFLFPVRADDKGGKRNIRLDGTEFVRRFLLHVLPTGIKRIRHYGVLASACKGRKLAAARLALAMPASNPVALESAGEFVQRVARMNAALCPCCGQGRLRTVTVLASPARLPAPGREATMDAPVPQGRGPP